MKNKYKIVVAIVASFTFIIAGAIISDWGHFKADLMGKSPVEKVQE